jgi:trimeric autotransporter adhesin
MKLVAKTAMRPRLLLAVTGITACFFATAQNVGIGTMTPVSRLHVRSTVSELLRLDGPSSFLSFYNGTSFFGQIGVTASDASMHLLTPSLIGGDIRILPNNNLNSIFTTNGALGIGTSTPSVRLHIKGLTSTGSELVRIEGNRPFITLYDNTEGYQAYWRWDGDVIFGTATTAPTTSIRIAPNASAAARFFPDGNTLFGPGLAATGYRVSVNGKLICTEARVQLTASWPDYVFSKNYALRSIDDLDKFIQANHHLPGIPSAKEMKGGQDLGDIQRRMMEKIEELTLYIIQLKKENDQLSRSINLIQQQ